MTELLTEKRVAQILQCTVSKLRSDRWYGRGLPYVKIGAGVRYLPEDIEAFIKANRIPPK